MLLFPDYKNRLPRDYHLHLVENLSANKGFISFSRDPERHEHVPDVFENRYHHSARYRQD